jgi:hypothetical protein
MPDHAVAVGAEKTADLACGMIVVNIQSTVLYSLADGTCAALFNQHAVVICLSDPVLSHEVALSFTLRVTSITNAVVPTRLSILSMNCRFACLAAGRMTVFLASIAPKVREWLHFPAYRASFHGRTLMYASMNAWAHCGTMALP